MSDMVERALVHYEDKIKSLEQKLSDYKARFEEKEGVYYINGRKFVPVEMLEESEKLIVELKKKAQMNIHNSAFNGLKDQLSEAIEVIKFYAKEGNWDDRILLILDDTEDTAYSSYNGGKRAREFLAKIAQVRRRNED